jgi:3-deoxy-D-manno-octulosonic acid (KDO) 8-phosphate synthase
MGTTVIGDSVSPDRKWDAVLMVRNGGAMTGYSTVISVVRANWVARQIALLALYRPVHVFVADDNDGAVRSGNRGQMDVKIRWASATELIIAYAEKARVARQDPRFRSVTIQYIASP